MASAIRNAVAIDPDLCRRVARARFSDRAMVATYIALYARLARAGARGIG